ncbi:hypothetical protein LV457_07510 [Mycobacterium sp. MYCO198283]|nr:hypothetical protein [Mycobacterium sp. MYCO198283]MCG5432138.1 hypothetical protein [Mycobacterium sp. MYCO198283]
MLAALSVLLVVVAGCGDDDVRAYGAETAKVGESLALLGWNITLANLRFDANHVMVDVDAAPAEPGAPRAKPEDIRFGLYGTLPHPIEATGLGSCDRVQTPVTELSATPDRMTGTVCLGPMKDQAPVRGVYAYSPADRMAGTAVAYPAAFPVGVLPTSASDTGLVVQTTSVEAFRADGRQLTEAALGDATVFTGNGYMLLGLTISGLAERYRDDSLARGGPMMVVAAPTLPGEGLSYACEAYGASVLVLPDTTLDAVKTEVSLCTQGEINAALLYPTVTVVATHAGLWTSRD